MIGSRSPQAFAVLLWGFGASARSETDFFSLHEGADATRLNGQLVFGTLASIAIFEQQVIRQRARAGLRNARAKGKHLRLRDCLSVCFRLFSIHA